MKKSRSKLWIGRFLIGWVLFTNLQCAILFILFPGRFVQGFEMTGVSGEAAVRGIGILFAMWNVPYCLAILQPQKFRLSLIEAVIMQGIGFVGETTLLMSFPQGHLFIRETVNRFILFDGSGLILLLLSVWITQDKVKLVNNHPI
ncbi:MAG: hypothetical protein P4L50_15070 [Anaerolineaceae bacterium]|nr:hypothetical protein [Anaerolineaceae bacterium]